VTGRLEPSAGNNVVLTEKRGNGKSLNIFLLNCTDYKKGQHKKLSLEFTFFRSLPTGSVTSIVSILGSMQYLAGRLSSQYQIYQKYSKVDHRVGFG